METGGGADGVAGDTEACGEERLTVDPLSAGDRGGLDVPDPSERANESGRTMTRGRGRIGARTTAAR